MATTGAIELHAVSVGYQARQPVLRDLSLRIEPSQLVAVLGASGSGKSTLLRTIAGLLLPFAGEVKLFGKSVEETPARSRSIGFVFQGLALFPNMTVAENVLFAASHANGSGPNPRVAVAALLSSLGISSVADKLPSQVSGGQAQRVALARALAASPRMLLLDEPFSNLDRPQSDIARELVVQVHASHQLTTVLVTHDREQAMLIADRIIVLGTDGVLLQDGSPSDVYTHPATAEVAALTGPVSFVSGLVTRITGREIEVSTEAGDIQALWGDSGSPVLDARVRLAIRPDWMSVTENDHSSAKTLRVTVSRAVMVGGRSFLHCAAGNALFMLENQALSRPDKGAAIAIRIDKAIAFAMENGEAK